MRRIKKYTLPGLTAICLGVIAFMTACNGDFEKLLPEQDNGDSINVIYGNPKVLYLIVDGARGVSVRDAEAPSITSLLPNSIYSWVSLSDEDAIAGKGTNWADLLTGVGKDKHRILNDDYSLANLENYPLIYGRIKEAIPESKISVFGSSPAFINKLSEGADVKEALGSDEEVTSSVISSLQEKDATLIVGQFREVDQAGAAHDYDISSPEYKDAILGFDERLGNILEALRNRPDYDTESWLVIITSSSGGDYDLPPEENDNTIFSKPDINTFTLLYSRKYDPRFIGKPYLGSKFQGDFARFNGQRNARLLDGENGVYNFGETEEFTIELKVKKNPGPNNNYQFRYPAVLGKRPEWSEGWPSEGWVIFLEDRFWMFNARGTNNGSGQVRGSDLADATWNSIAVSSIIRNGEKFVRTYTNGNYNNEINISSWGGLVNAEPLTLGYLQGSGHGEPDVYVSDVRIWRYAIPDSIIQQFACETYIDASHPYYEYLAGYWPVYGGVNGDTVIRDEGPLGNHLALSEEGFSWDRLNEFICAPASDVLGGLVQKSVDVPAQLFSWLKIARREDWELDGRVWLDQ